MPGAMRTRSRRAFLAALLAPWFMARHEPAALGADARGAAAARAIAKAGPIATEVPVSTAALPLPGADATEIVSRLTVPPGAHWATPLPNGSLLLLIEKGGLRVSMLDNRARIARAFDPFRIQFALPEVRPGEQIFLAAGDRLVARGDGEIAALNTGVTTAIASIVRVTSRPVP